MPVVDIALEQITDRDSFHDAFASALSFPDFYGRNMDAWIDCMSDPGFNAGLRDARDDPGDILTLQLTGAASFRLRCPALWADVIDCAAFVNWREVQGQRRPMLAIAYRDWVCCRLVVRSGVVVMRLFTPV